MQEKKQLPGWLFAVLFPAVLLYYEFILRISTTPAFPLSGTVYMLLFSVAYAGIGYLIVSLFKRKKVAYIVTLVWLILSVAPFLIEYFVYLQFNIFYDVSTCLNGAADALSDYLKELFMLIFSWDGLSRIFLFLLPTALFAIFGRRYATPNTPGLRKWLITAVATVLVFLFASFGISDSSTLSLMCGKEYNFQGVVSNLGLMTGLRMDVAEYLSPDAPEAFEAVVAVPPVVVPATQPAAEADAEDAAASDGTIPEETEPVVYTPNVMDIDFDAVSSRGSLGELNAYVSSLTPSMKNEYTGLFEGKNLILITAEAFTAEVIDPELTPTLYRLTTQGIEFTNYYEPLWSGCTSGGELVNLSGLAMNCEMNTYSRQKPFNTIGAQLMKEGYFSRAYHNNIYTFYDRHKTHVDLGYEKFIGMSSGMEEGVQDVWPQSDLEMFDFTVPQYIDQQPFSIYYMTVSGHCRYNRLGNAQSKKNWDLVQHLPYSDGVKAYFACNLELEKGLASLVKQLEDAGIADDTVIVMAPDHYPYGLGKAWGLPHDGLAELYGVEKYDLFQRDKNTLIIWSGCLEDMDLKIDAPVCSIDILPTLSNLFGVTYDSRMTVGRDVLGSEEAISLWPDYSWVTELGSYTATNRKFTPFEGVEIPEGYVERINSIVTNKVKFSRMVQNSPFFTNIQEELNQLQ